MKFDVGPWTSFGIEVLQQLEEILKFDFCKDYSCGLIGKLMSFCSQEYKSLLKVK